MSFSLFKETTVSIQLLFRWNSAKPKNKAYKLLFQYNCCFGGILTSLGVIAPMFSFNTTVVSVELNIPVYPIKIKQVSIQLLFRWNFF